MVAKQFYYGMNTKNVGKRAHVLKHSHVRCVVGAFDNFLHEGSIWTGHRSVLYFILHKKSFFTLNTMGKSFMKNL